MQITLTTPVEETPRVLQIRGMFDLPAEKASTVTINANLPINEKPWNIGLIVGPSGCGKSSIARHQWPGSDLPSKHNVWDCGHSILDSFPQDIGIKEIVEVLSSVGFSSPPAWLRPFHILSTGQQFRVAIARLICEALSPGSTKYTGGLPGTSSKEAKHHAPIVIDEFTSVVDRTTAKIGSCAIAKTVRAKSLQLVAVTCHEDVMDWLQPDWVYEPHRELFTWRSLCKRPTITLAVFRCRNETWSLFAPHHYLDTRLSRGSVSFLATWEGKPVAFSAWIPWFGAGPPTRREHRTVTLPDYQGVGVGNAVSNLIASMWKTLGYRATSTTTHPAMIRARLRNNNWKMVRPPSFLGTNDIIQHSSNRLTAGFEWIGPTMKLIEAKALHGV